MKAAPGWIAGVFISHTMKEKETGAYYIIIPAPIRNHPRLSVMAKFLYGEIAAKTSIYGYCWASNEFICEVMQATERTVQRYLKELTDEGFIKCEYSRRSEKVERKIYLIISYGTQNDKIDAAKNDVLPVSGSDNFDVRQNDKIDGYINNTIKKNNKTKKNNNTIPPAGEPASGSQATRPRRSKKEKAEDTPPGGAPPPLEKVLHQQFIDTYHKWFMERNGGVKPHIAGKDAKAVKTLIGSMAGAVKGAAEVKGEIITEQDLPEHVLKGWSFMLSNWGKLTPFLQQQTDLCQISSNFNNIISILKNGTGKIKPINGQQADSRTPAERFNSFYERAKREYPTTGQGGSNDGISAVHG
jgi:hypothetical protein